MFGKVTNFFKINSLTGCKQDSHSAEMRCLEQWKEVLWIFFLPEKAHNGRQLFCPVTLDKVTHSVVCVTLSVMNESRACTCLIEEVYINQPLRAKSCWKYFNSKACWYFKLHLVFHVFSGWLCDAKALCGFFTFCHFMYLCVALGLKFRLHYRILLRANERPLTKPLRPIRN